MPRLAYVNGRFVPYAQASVHIEDRGFQFADGVYEVIACINGILADAPGHLDRLERSLGELQMDMPVRRQTLGFLMRELLRKNRLKNAAIYIQVTRGSAKRDFKFPDPDDTPQSLIITCRPFRFDGNPFIEKGIRAITVPDLRWSRRDIKTVALLPQAMAKQKAAESGAQEAWMVDEAGYITEGSSSNAYIVKGNTLKTRRADHDILKGVTRTALQRIIKDMDLIWEDEAFTPEEAYRADEAFTSSATSLIMPVIELDGRRIGNGKPGPVTRKFYEEYRNYVRGFHGDPVRWRA